jgi:predicted enzyme related to lactoylglutathione lyase
MEYYVIMNGSRPNGGMMTISPEMGEMPPNWTVYFSVADIDKIAEKAQSMGGHLAMPVMDAGAIGRIGFIIDPTGAMAAYIQTTQPQEWDLN